MLSCQPARRETSPASLAWGVGLPRATKSTGPLIIIFGFDACRFLTLLGLKCFTLLGLRNSTNGAPRGLCSAATLRANRLGIASTIPGIPQNHPPNQRAPGGNVGRVGAAEDPSVFAL